MTNRIRVDYDEVTNLITRINTQTEAMTEMERAIQNCMNALQNGGWIGRGATAFYEEMESLVMPATHKVCESLEETSHSLTAVSQLLQNAEDESSSYFSIA